MRLRCHNVYGQRLGFTLIELMVVIAIIGILFLTAIPALQSITAKNLNTASMQLTSTLRLARQTAITQRKNVWVVFPDLQSPYSPATEVNKALTSYAVLTTNAETHAYEYITEWKFLPKGVFFDPLYPKAEVPVFKSHQPGLTVFPFPNDGGEARNMSAILFKPNGSANNCGGGIWSAGTGVWIPITSERYYEDNLVTGDKTLSPKNPVGTNIIIRIRGRTGQSDYVTEMN